MENAENSSLEEKDQKKWMGYSHNPIAKVFLGIVFIAAGALLFADKLGYDIPYRWLFSWPMLLIVIGIYTGIKHSFRHFSWLILVGIGSIFLADRLIADFTITPYLWPIAIMGVGLFIILKPKRKFGHNKWQQKWERYQSFYETPKTTEDFLDSTTVFSGVKKNIFSKDFKGGKVSNTFGGAEINLSNADINGKVVLEVEQVFGGTVLIIPAHWELQSELVAILGGIEDKRSVSQLSMDHSKILVLKGNTVLGGIEIRSY